jgi:hypothetical protein
MVKTALEEVYAHVAAYQAGQYHDDSMAARLLRYFARTELGQWMIRDVHAALVPLKLNEVQLRVLVLMLKQAAAGKPVRIVILKSRKTGVSTETETIGVDLCAYEQNQIAMTVAHADIPTKEIFDIAKLAAECHSALRQCDVQASLFWGATRSKYFAQTAGGTAVGAGGTPSFLHTSEGPKWEKNKQETFTNTVNSVPSIPNSIIIHEFTAKGRDLFFDLFEAAGEEGHPYERIFIAWYLDSTLKADVPDGFETDADEMALIRRARVEGIELSNQQLQWRRNKIQEIGADLFRQEYPSTPAEAVQGSKGLIFPHMRDAVFGGGFPFDLDQVDTQDRVGGIDFGYNDATVIWSGVYLDQTLWITDYWRATESMATDQVRGLHRGHLYYCDPPNLTERIALQRESQAFGMNCRFAPAPRRKNPGEDVTRIELQQVVKVLDKGRLRIPARLAAQLIVECDTLAWDEKTGKADDKRNDNCGHYDSIQGLKYMVMGVLNRGEKHVPRERVERAMTRAEEFAAF